MKLLVSSALLVGVALADPGHHGHGYRSHGYRTYGYRSHGHHGHHYGKRDAEPVAVAEADASAEPGYYAGYGYGGYGLGYGYGGYGLGYGYRSYGYRSHGHYGHHYGKRDAEPVAAA